ncbi:protein SHOOT GRAVITROPISM 6 isoform X1 [Physcomitrium patens]|uniref:protein SHOOT GRAVITROPISM 6 isoform X1 n=1 Tax=Physcomitrium patens TaxID=3218 RepID=UPI000D1684C3|nr:protein SHOOT GRAVITROPISM 6-like isoform X1 [Physcomitrium patens]|eukprot:XP_024369013.1 protein SHOOT GRAVITROPISM 6-like isoform X1 [Physcomitrella patens]
MAMAIEGTSISPRTAVIRVLVGAVGDNSSTVQDAAAAALRQNARQNATTVLDCCAASLRGSKKRSVQLGNYRAGLLLIMAHTVREMRDEEVDAAFMRKVTKLAMADLSMNKEMNPDWLHSASSLLVALGSRFPDMMMDEIFNQLGGPSVPVVALVQTLSEFAKLHALQFAPRLKNVLSRVLPLLGSVKDSQRNIFAKAMTSWCEAVSQHQEASRTPTPLGSDLQALLHSAFELFLNSWVLSRDRKVRSATAEALGELVGLMSKPQLTLALPRLLPAILAVYKKEKEDPLPAAHSLHMVLNAVLLNYGSPLVDFQALLATLNVLLPVAYFSTSKGSGDELSSYLKSFNEVLHCFVIIGAVYPEEMYTFLLHRLKAREDPIRLGSCSVIKHLLTRLSEPWASRKVELVEVVGDLLQEKDLNTKKAVAELIVSMASHGVFTKDTGEPYVEFLVQQCAISDAEVERVQAEHAAIEKAMGMLLASPNKTEINVGAVSPSELRAVSEKSLLLLAGIVANVEVVLWPLLLKMLVVEKYTGAASTVCRCISELSRRKLARAESIYVDYTLHADIPRPEEVLARLLVLLQDPMARDQLGSRILTVLYHIGPLFPPAVVLLWEDEIPKLRTYITDADDMRGDALQQTIWEDMIIHLLSESLDVIRDQEWTISMGNAFTKHYDLYVGDNQHSALLHRCMGMLLQKVNNRSYVQQKITAMYKHADLADEVNRLGLAKGMGLVAASHLDTVLEKLRRVLESQNQTGIRRVIAYLFSQGNTTEVDDVCAALALMYGYAASYAPSAAIEARIETLVGTNMLSGFLNVRSPAAKQAVITAISLLGQAVLKAAANGAFFPLKKRDTMLDYTMALMADQGAGYVLSTSKSLDAGLLRTQELALNACTTLVSVEPKLTMTTRDRILQATLGFFTLPPETVDVTSSLLSSLTTLLCAILLTSGDDGKSRADQLQHLLKNLDQYVASPIDYQRQRASYTVLALLKQFRALCTTGSCPFNCAGNCMHLRSTAERIQSSSAGISAPLLPPREGLKLGERIIAYLPRCSDVSSEVRKTATEILDLLFSTSLLLPRPVGAEGSEDRQASYAAVSALEDLIALTNWETSTEDTSVLKGILSSVGVLLTTQEVVAGLKGCVPAICDKVPQSAKGSIIAVTDLIVRRGAEIGEADVSRIIQALFTAASYLHEKINRQKVLAAMCCLAEHPQARVVFNEVLGAADKDASRTKQKGAWPVQEAYLALANHCNLSLPFLNYVVSIINDVPVFREDEADKADSESSQNLLPHTLNKLPAAATLALGCIFRSGNEVATKAVEQQYSAVLCALILRIGSCHGTASLDSQPLRDVIPTFQSFCECVGDEEMSQVLMRDGEHRLSGDRWTEAIEEIAACSAKSRPQQVSNICTIIWPALKRTRDFQRAAAAAALSDYIKHSEEDEVLLGQLVGVLCAHIGDDSPSVRRLCVKGLVQIPELGVAKYASQILSVIVALIEDAEEEVALEAVQGLGKILDFEAEVVPEAIVAPMLLNLCVRLRSLQGRQKENTRAAAFAALGSLTRYAVGVQLEAFMEQVHATLPRLVLHINDEAPSVCQACKDTLKRLAPLLHAQDIRALVNLQTYIQSEELEYDEFVREFAKHLVLQFGDRVDTYVTAAMQAFESPWPLIQANAVYFAGCMLSEISDSRPLAIYLPQVTGALVRMTASAPSAVVRAKSALALSLLLDEMKS